MEKSDDRTDWFIVRVEHYGKNADIEKMRAELEKQLRLKVFEEIQVFSTSKLKLKFSVAVGKLRWKKTT